jgi:hypothetical protein
MDSRTQNLKSESPARVPVPQKQADSNEQLAVGSWLLGWMFKVRSVS